MSRPHPYHNGSQQRVLRVLLALFGHEIDGLTPTQIAKAVQANASAITRDIHNLIEVGVAERLPHNDNVRVSPLLGRKALQIMTNIDTAARRIDETRNRYTRTPD